jgi:hypothetical protein
MQVTHREAELSGQAAAAVEACHVEEIFADSKFLVSRGAAAAAAAAAAARGAHSWLVDADSCGCGSALEVEG